MTCVADTLFVAYAETGGTNERLCREVLEAGMAIFTLDIAEKSRLLSLGARPVSEGSDWIIRTGLTVDGGP